MLNNSHLLKKTHICGIGGIGMCGVAHLLLDMGCTITGSDLRHSELTDSLENRGVLISYSPQPDRLAGASCVIAPRAFPKSHPELLEAQNRNLPVLHRAQALGLICSQNHCRPTICFGTAARGKLPWLFAHLPDSGRCAGAALHQLNSDRHAVLGPRMMIDVDEREFLCNPSDFEFLNGADVIISDWQDLYGYYQQKNFSQFYQIQPDQFLNRIQSDIMTQDSILIHPVQDSDALVFCIQKGSQLLETSAFHIDISRKCLYLPDAWNADPIPFCGSVNDASALAAACLWHHFMNIPTMPNDVECVGWFHPIADRQFHDIRMHPVNVHHAVQTLKCLAHNDKIGIVIRPFAPTLNAYDLNYWLQALNGIHQLIIISPAYEGCSSELCDEFARTMSSQIPHVQTVSLEKAHQIAQNRDFWLWLGAGDILP